MFHASYSWSGPQLPKGCGCIGFLSPMHKKIPESDLERAADNPQNSGIAPQQYSEIPYPRTVWNYIYNTWYLAKHSTKKRRTPSHQYLFRAALPSISAPLARLFSLPAPRVLCIDEKKRGWSRDHAYTGSIKPVLWT